MKKHAFLIMAHGQPELLKQLIAYLDDERNDIYLHIDRKSAELRPEDFRSLTRNAGLFLTERIPVVWGGYSQIRCELLLLKNAVKKGYSYYHLISGADVPLVSQNEFHTFFERIDGKEIVGFSRPEISADEFDRFNVYHFFQDKIGRDSSVLSRIEHASIRLQHLLRIGRAKRYCKKYGVSVFQKGTNWFDITDDLAEYVLAKEEEIRKMYRWTLCCDEVFLQLLVANSPFRDRLFYKGFGSYLSSLRYVDWKRGSPYVFREQDYEELVTSGCFFARKFDLSVDAGIVEKLYRRLSDSQSDIAVIRWNEMKKSIILRTS
ncbi:beta-1,6-N-acetylglucosaminyltransferase [Caproiciproducens sp.]